jgi:hypothetical protein
MTVQSQVATFIPRQYEIFVGLDVDKHSIAVTFTDHARLLKSLRLPYSSEQLLNYTRKHFPDRRLAFVYEAGPTGFGLYDDLRASGHPCLVVAPSDGSNGAWTTRENQSARQQESCPKGCAGANSAAFMCPRRRIANCGTWFNCAIPTSGS